MKTRSLVTKAMALLMASAMVMGNTGMVVHASDDGCAREEREAGGSSASDGSDNIGGGSSYSEPAPSYSESNHSESGSSSSSGSYDSYDDGCAREERETGGSSASDGSDNIGSSSASYSAPAPKAAGVSASAGKETFRAIAKAGAGTYKVMHKGVEVATFHLMDADKKAVSCTKVTLKKRDDGKYAINYEVADATGLTIGAPVDRTYMYTVLGVSYLTINDTIIADIESEAAAAATK